VVWLIVFFGWVGGFVWWQLGMQLGWALSLLVSDAFVGMLITSLSACHSAVVTVLMTWFVLNDGVT
jgi:hypothetical protein